MTAVMIGLIMIFVGIEIILSSMGIKIGLLGCFGFGCMAGGLYLVIASLKEDD